VRSAGAEKLHRRQASERRVRALGVVMAQPRVDRVAGVASGDAYQMI
jgi:hypothetical protein